ncbi:MAG: hypothetical protein HQK52_00450 [Oligoflexia bacterium]|nr:hypothetical protein [Oligoflexia bacterium]
MKINSILIKVFISLCIVFALIFGAAYYYFSRLTPDELKQMVTTTMEKQFPNSKIAIEKISYSFGFSFKIKIEGVSLSLKSPSTPEETDLFALAQVNLKIPFWAIFTNGGSIDLNAHAPNINFVMADKTHNNWTKALASPQKSEEDLSVAVETTTAANTISLKKYNKVIAFFANSDLNIKITDINLTYQLADKSRGKVILSRFIIKNLGIKTSSAFEVASTIEFHSPDQKRVSFDSIIIGQINSHEIIFNKDIETTLLVNIENLILPGLQKPLPPIKSDLKLKIFRETKEITLENSTDLNILGHVGLNLHIKENNIALTNLNANFVIKEFLDNFAPEIKLISINNSSLKINGNVQVKDKHIVPTLDFSLSEELKIKMNDLPDISTNFSCEIKDEVINVFVKNNLMSGTSDLNINTNLDINNLARDFGQFNPIQISLSMSNLNIDHAFIQKMLYEKKKTSPPTSSEQAANKQTADAAKPTAAVAVAETNSPPPSPEAASASKLSTKQAGTTKKGKQQTTASSAPPLSTSSKQVIPPLNIDIKFANIKIGNETLSGSSKVTSKGNQIISEDTHFNYSSGRGDISFKLDLISPKEKRSDWKFSLTNLNLDALRPFLPPNIEGISGLFSGKVNGNLHLVDSSYGKKIQSKMSYNVDYDLSATKGAIEGLKLSEFVEQLAARIPFFKEYSAAKDLKISNHFEKLLLQGNAKESLYSLQNFTFIGINKLVEIKGSGQLYPPPPAPQTSTSISMLELSYTDHTDYLAPILQKHLGSTTIPMLLKGPGFSLSPDYKYTIEKLILMAATNQKDKLKSKVEEKLKEKIEDALKDKLPESLKQSIPATDKKDLKKLFKGLF